MQHANTRPSWTAISDIILAISKIGIFNSIPIILSGLNLYPNPDGCIKVRSRVAQVAYDILATNRVAQVAYYIVATNRETESFLIVNSSSQSVGGSGQAGTGGTSGMSKLTRTNAEYTKAPPEKSGSSTF